MVDWNPFTSDESTDTRSDGGRPVERSRTDPDRATLEAQLDAARTERDEATARAERLEDELTTERARREQLQSAIEALTTVISANAKGDLTATPPETDIESATGLYDAYGELLAEWRDTVDRMASFSEQVSSATEQVDDRIDSVKTASREVSGAVEEISSGSQHQSERIQDISSEMESLSATIEEIAASANEVATASAEATDRGGGAQQSATEARAELERLTEHADDTVEKIERLHDLLTDIEDIVAFITDVADQTNILALNANIEAARAGEDGSGFGVVASEVKDLASETKQAADEITASIEQVHEQAEATVETVHRTSQTVETTRGTVDETIDQLDTVVEQVQEIDAAIQEIDEATDTQARSTQEIVSMTNQVGEISDETAEEATVAATAAQKQTTELAEVSTRVSTLADRATTLETTLDQFELADTAADADETVVEFWHAMGGEKALLLEELAREFEAQTEGISISLASKGSYRGTLDAALAAAREGSPPAITQIFEIGTTRARDSDQFVPVDRLLARDHLDSLLDPVTNYYRFDGQLHSLPFNASNPILAYNRAAFEAAGLDPDSPPATLDAVREASARLVDTGVADYGITFANYSWFVEQWFAQADEPLVDRDNGRSGAPTTSNLDGSFARSLFEWWTEMETAGYYHDPGIEARGAAREAFHAGEAAMLVGSTSSLTAIESGADFAVGTGRYPVLADRTGVLVGGASLWVGADLPDAVHDAVGEFLTWLTEPAQQCRWHRQTGYFPVHEAAIPQLRENGWFEDNPQYETAFRQLMDTADTTATRGAQIGPFETVRTIVEEGYEQMDSVESVPETLETMDQQIEATLADYDPSV